MSVKDLSVCQHQNSLHLVTLCAQAAKKGGQSLPSFRAF
ncbi:conserved hypothetical protein [Acidithiobacillus caldus SM-1]|uniref:Uncharacterized protein n=2 Tax=Acidithiobacillus caldus TaxID=33059 RepID=F9ZMF8_ACICS|nr:conserved hypothetical protein [Acidithiobacillus caldus SM-1]AIA54568.1 hypothetical protein Acaty_c0688 [Acidithiobacillus caldus ATCC 51756]QER44860.1 hypothetical protein F0726_01796 [Acidithiobacillus caldus]